MKFNTDPEAYDRLLMKREAIKTELSIVKEFTEEAKKADIHGSHGSLPKFGDIFVFNEVGGTITTNVDGIQKIAGCSRMSAYRMVNGMPYKGYRAIVYPSGTLADKDALIKANRRAQLICAIERANMLIEPLETLEIVWSLLS